MKFTRLPKIPHLIAAGVPVEAIPTYAALCDYTNNKTGLCWPRMETLALNLGRSVRTVQRHLHQLQDLGLVEFVERRRWRGRFSSYTYRVLHIAALIRRKKASSTTGHGRRVGKPPPIVTRTRRSKTAPSDSPSDDYRWLFGREAQYHDQEIINEQGQMGLFKRLSGSVKASEVLRSPSQGSNTRKRLSRPQIESSRLF